MFVACVTVKCLSSTNIAQNSLCTYSLNSDVLGPQSLFVQVPPVATSILSFLTLHVNTVCVGEFDWLFNKLPKHAFLSHTPLALSRFSLRQDAQQRGVSVKSPDNTETLRHHLRFCLSKKKGTRTDRSNNGAASSGDPVASSRMETPLHLHASEMSSSQSLSLEGRHGHSPNPHLFISSSTFQSLSGDLYKTTLTDLNRHVRGVCNPQRAL